MNSMARACSMVVNLLFPRGCAGCDKPDEVLCEACRALFSQPTAQSFDGVAMQRWFAWMVPWHGQKGGSRVEGSRRRGM